MLAYVNELKEPNGRTFARISWNNERLYIVLPDDHAERERVIKTWRERIRPYNGHISFYPINDAVIEVLKTHDKMSLPFYHNISEAAASKKEDLNAVIIR